jgi:glycosyltransferase involved in cell wall biosynthesis
MKVLVNAFGISNAGGITVLKKTIYEFLDNQENEYYIFVFRNQNVLNLVQKFNNIDNIHFKIYNNYGILLRLLYENLYFLSFALKNNITLIYNLTGTRQLFFGIPSLLKIQNLLFFTKKLDEIYLNNNHKILWLKQVWFKRIIFVLMLRFTKYIEIQSTHVKEELSNFINVDNKSFFIKSDFLIHQNHFSEPKKYDFDKTITFLYVVGPHFSFPHKNISDFVKTMEILFDSGLSFHINITLNYEELKKSGLWNDKLNSITSFLGYIESKKRMETLFSNNVILISTSVTETLGLHVIEATLNGVLCIVPNELYSKCVYGSSVLTYNLFDCESLVDVIIKLKTYNNSACFSLIVDNQKYIRQNEKNKYHNSLSIFNDVLKDEK